MHSRESTDNRGEVLVAIIKAPSDLAIVRDQHWYRIPVSSVNKRLKKRWPPRWLAFYLTKVFGHERHAVNYYARVVDIRKVYRWELFQDNPPEKRNRRYYQLFLQPLRRLPKPILSRRFRNIIFIPTTWHKFINAVEINDLYDESPLEDRLWAEFKRLQLLAERQELIEAKEQNYFLDFAIYCAKGNIDIETDGDSWHASPERSAEDNVRDNNIKTAGWKVLRFNGVQIREQMQEYCLPTIEENINQLGGVDEGGTIPRVIGSNQLTLFDE